ncbi:MAG: N-acetylmuramoyl-L-alanine amidase [Phycisphaerales bacterium]|nr:N-acetylmuramoyl-L-alanine amidase [Phycisphaerales bacterium]
MASLNRKPVTASRPSRRSLSQRAKIVWMALLGAMTGVGGLLLVVDGRPVPRVQGRSLEPLVATQTPGSIESIFKTRQTLQTERWQAIVIHHSGSAVGSPASIATEHEARGLKGLGHHFLIGNGSGMRNGEINACFRWLDQLPGAHAAGPQGDWHNLNAISICLVGDGNRRAFTQAQVQSTVQLVEALCRELDIPRDKVLLHSAVANTSDPGDLFPEAAFREQLGQ